MTGREPPAGFELSAQVFFTLCFPPQIERVRLLLNGKPNFFYSKGRHPHRIVTPLSRRVFRFWSEAPCAFRTVRSEVRCRHS